QPGVDPHVFQFVGRVLYLRRNRPADVFDRRLRRLALPKKDGRTACTAPTLIGTDRSQSNV
ncbi:MAG TPA: hypothetical protein VGJ15_13255, partial [Pirellulales bacterium]